MLMGTVQTRSRIPFRARGLSLLELMIYVAVLATLAVPLGMITVSSSRAAAEGDMFSKVLERNRTALNRVIADYRSSRNGTTLITNGGKTLQFTSTTGFDGTAPIAGPVIRYVMRLDPAEAANGLDDNKNGLIDESILVHINQTTLVETVISYGLNTAASSFVANGAGITVNLVHAGTTHATSGNYEVRRAVNVFPRN